MRTKGTLISWNDGKGFGFIVPVAGGDQVFVHISAFANKDRRPEPNQVVTYELSSDKQGRPCAVNATLAGDKPLLETKRSKGRLRVIVAVCFVLIVGASVLIGRLPPWIFIIYVLVSGITFITYAWDKSAAKKGVWRTPESTLHLLSLVGGWPGALIAQKLLRHKSKKAAFRVMFWITVALNCAVFFWLLSSSGAETLRSWLN